MRLCTATTRASILMRLPAHMAARLGKRLAWCCTTARAASRRAEPATELPRLRVSAEAPGISRGRGGRIDHLLHFGDLCRRKAADLGVFADDGLVLGEIDAKGLVVGYVALDPLNVGTELMQDLVRFCSRRAQLFALECADFRNIPFDDELA